VSAPKPTRRQIESLLAELNTGLLDEDEFNRRADAIGLTEQMAEDLMWGPDPVGDVVKKYNLKDS